MRRLREARGWQQETLAQNACAELGVDWTRETVLRLEQGRRKLGAGELLGLCFLFRVPLAELLQGAGDAWPTAGLKLAAAEIPQLLEGERPPSAESPVDRRIAPHVPRAGARPDLADDRAAKAIGATPLLISLLSHKLWGRSLSAERDRRAGPGANRMKKAHATRELYTELSAAIAQAR